MDLLAKIKKLFSKKETSIEAPEEYCPNCWGKQEYGGQFYEALVNENIDLNNVEEKKGWIQAYAARHLEGIKLKTTGQVNTCPSCKLSYKPTDSE